MPPPRDPIELLLRQAVLLQRLANGIVRDSDGVIRTLFEEIAAAMAKLDPTAVAPRYRRDRLDRLLAQVAALATDVVEGDWRKEVRTSLAGVGKQQGDAAVMLLRVTLGSEATHTPAPGPTVNMMKAVLDRDPFQGETLSGWAENQAVGVVRRVRQQIQLGMAQEEGIGDLLARVAGGKHMTLGPLPGVVEASRRDAEAVVRTAVTFVANRAAEATYSANDDVTSEYEYVATLDSRTTLRCASLDGRRFRYDDASAPRPPQHFNCRSIIAPQIDWKALGIEPPDDGTRAARDPETGKTEQVPAGQKYESWLKAQPASVQDEILGPGRGKLFRDGKVSLSDLVKSDGTVVRLADLPGGGLRDLGASGGDVPLGQARQRILPEVRAGEKSIVGKRWEYARAWQPATGEGVLFGADWKGRGGKLEYTSGKPGAINFSERDKAKLADAIVTHNHPSGATFSAADLQLAGEANMLEIRAVGSKNTYSALRPAGGWDTDALGKAVEGFTRDWEQLRRRGGANNAAAHALWKKYLGDIGVTYNVYLTPK